MKIRAYYNPYNIDSVLAAYLLLLKVDSENTDDFSLNQVEKTKLELIQSQRNINLQNTSQELVDTIYVLGVPVRQADMYVLCKQAMEVISFSYIGGENYSDDHGEHHTPVKDSTSVEESLNNSLCSMFIMQSDTGWLVDNELMNLVSAVYKYVNLMPMDKKELSILFGYYDQIISCVEEQKYSKLQTVVEEDTVEKEFVKKVMSSSRVKNARQIISRNMDMHLFGNASMSKVIPTINIGQELNQVSMRLIRMAHESVVSYEDIKNQRMWHISTVNQSSAMEIANLIPHNDAWFDNTSLCLLSDLPAFTK